MAKVLDDSLNGNEFKLRSHYYLHFRANTFEKPKKPLIFPVIGQMVPLLFFYNFGFGI